MTDQCAEAAAAHCESDMSSKAYFVLHADSFHSLARSKCKPEVSIAHIESPFSLPSWPLLDYHWDIAYRRRDPGEYGLVLLRDFPRARGRQYVVPHDHECHCAYDLGGRKVPSRADVRCSSEGAKFEAVHLLLAFSKKAAKIHLLRIRSPDIRIVVNGARGHLDVSTFLDQVLIVEQGVLEYLSRAW